jgi:membrane protease YdiL (CAAX protease family)
MTRAKLFDLLKVVTFIFLSFASTFLLQPLLIYFYRHCPAPLYFYTGTAAFDFALALGLLYVFGIFIEKRSLKSYGFSSGISDNSEWGTTSSALIGKPLAASRLGQILKETLAGAGVAAFMVSTVMLVLYLAGAYTVSEAAWHNDFLAYLPFLLMAAMREEIIFRGYVLQTLEKSWGAIPAMITSAVMFGFLHLLNFDEHVSLQSQLYSCLCLSIDAGLIFAVAFYMRRRLWFPFGMHVTWNVFEGPVYGTFVSSLTLGTPLLTGHLKGNMFITGGVFGPEASLVEVAVCLVLVAVMWPKLNLSLQKQ